MAKKTKDSNLSLEEKLEQALIPNWDEPYKLPDNWCWTKIGVVSNLYRGVSYKKHEGHSEKGKDDCLVMRGGNIQEGKIDIDSDNIYVSKELISGEQHIRKHDVVIVSSTGSTKVIGRAGISFADYDDVAFGAFLTLVRPIERVYKPYVAYFFQGDMYRNRMRQLASGVNINNIRNEFITDTPIPLPPLSEQQRIVARIESLFAKLDEAKEKSQEVVDGFEARKVAILHKAFSGELTQKWREENGVSLNTWTVRKINQVCNPRAGYAFDSKKFTDTGYQIIRMGNLYGGELDLNRNPVFILDSNIDDSILRRSLINDGDILITLTGTKYKRDYGYAVCIKNPNKLLVNQRILCLTPKLNEIETDYLLFYLQSDLFRDVFFSNETGGVNQGNVSSKFVENIELNLPTNTEQKEIGSILRDTLEKEQQVKEKVEAVIEQIDAMKKAILARAFRGELGTNDPSEENAVELVKNVLMGNTNQQELPKSNKKSSGIPDHIVAALLTKLEKKIVNLFYTTESKVISVDEIMSVSSKKLDIIDTLTKLEHRGILIRLNNSCYRIKE